MGINYVLELAFAASDTQAVLHKLANCLWPDQRELLLAHLPWHPGHVAEGYLDAEGEDFVQVHMGMPGCESLLLNSAAHDDPHSNYCLCFGIPLTPELYNELYTPELADLFQPDVLKLGCIWTDLAVGQQYACLRFMAATRSISRIFKQTGFQQWFTTQFSAQAQFILLDTNDSDARLHLLSPFEISVNAYPEQDEDLYYDGYYFMDFQHPQQMYCFSPDHYVALIQKELILPNVKDGNAPHGN